VKVETATTTTPNRSGRPAGDRCSSSSGTTRNFTVNDAVYVADTASDRDDDGIACEKP
jgi:hypothetical protein